MAVYKIAPNSSGEIGMGQMRYGLSASADYNASNIHTTSNTSIETLVVNSTNYQSDLASKTWDTSQPYGFAEMYGQTWEDAFLILFTQPSDANCGKGNGEIFVDGISQTTFSKLSSSSPSPLSFNFSGSASETITISASADSPTGASCIESFTSTNIEIYTGPSVSNLTLRVTVSSNSSPGHYSFNHSSNEDVIRVVYVPTA